MAKNNDTVSTVKTVDEKAPQALTITITDGNGKSWGTAIAVSKQFSTGSTGFYGSGKLVNPENPAARYQLGINLILIGSKG